MGKLTTTSYAVLSLLAVEPMTTYQLAKQMERSLRDVWPRAESVIYEEPKKLVAGKYASVRIEHTGRRRSTVYAITAAGRRALREWLAVPGLPPSVDFEGLLKVAFGDHGDLASLRRNIDAIAAMASARTEYLDERIEEYRTTGGPYPDRLPVTTLIARFHLEQAAAAQRWADWAGKEVKRWNGVTPESGAKVPRW